MPAAEMTDNNGLRDETGALIGGLVVFDYNDGIADFEAGRPPPDVTSPSYDLGRQRAAERAEAKQEVLRWMDEQSRATERRLREILTEEQYAAYRADIARLSR